jgi:predicted ATPase
MRIDEVYLREVGPFDEAHIVFPPGRDPERADTYLLVGPNGTGKSTVLEAIASTLASGALIERADAPETMLREPGREARRMRSGSSAAYLVSETSVLALARPDDERSRWPDFRAGQDELYLSARVSNGLRLFSRTNHESGVLSYAWAASRFAPGWAHRRTFDFAAFAYSGSRTLSSGRVPSLREPSHSPFENSLAFKDVDHTQRLAEWFMYQEVRRLRAKDAGQHERAQVLGATSARVAEIVSEIIGEPFALVIADDDLGVLARVGDRAIDLDLLPDGLKSILSWTADLLMRLSRIPWVDDLPIDRREFLLLLDEIDLHLHPEWQRRVLPIVQRVFPRAQIVASTHSPFVVASARDAHVVSLERRGQAAVVAGVRSSPEGSSYATIIEELFGVHSEYDVEIEASLRRLRDAKEALLSGQTNDRGPFDREVEVLQTRSEELAKLAGFEVRQVERQLAMRGRA